MRYRKPIRLERDRYNETAALFHCIVRVDLGRGTLPEDLGDEIWKSLLQQAADGRIDLVAACLMPDHIHVIAGPGSLDIVGWLNAWKSFTTQQARKLDGRRHLWHPSFWDRAVRTGALDSTVAYVVANPVAAGFVSDWKVWRWTYVSHRLFDPDGPQDATL